MAEQDHSTVTEQFPTLHGVPLRLSFIPEAVREHFADDDSDVARAVAAMSEADLIQVASAALRDDRLYEAFHAALVEAAQEHQAGTGA